MLPDIRKDVFRGLSSPVYRSYHDEYDDKDSSLKRSSSPLSNFLGILRLPRRHTAVAALNTLLLILFFYNLPSIPTFLRSGPSAMAKSNALFSSNPAELTMLPSERQARLIEKARNVSASSPFPKKIWQTWKTIALPDDDNYKFTSSWQKKNPTHEYELLTDATAERYVIDNFNETDPYIVELYRTFPKRILAADLLRYLVVYRSGGLYTDLDTECKMPIDRWMDESLTHLPGVEASDINVVIGMELDVLNRTRWSDDWVRNCGFSQRIQFIQWTIWARPGHEILRRMITSVQETVRADIALTSTKTISALRYTPNDILDRTGPWRWTRVIQRYVDEIEGRTVSIEEFGDIRGARRFGDVLFLSGGRWSPGLAHSGSDQTDSFLAHHFRGSWKGDK
ncbi:membrane-bound alpha-1,6- mannosyltransferase Initiation-specific [Orbilia brochopaga]|uniref:Membrane-bound alpha-1,6- mannosyltransferase Initiation-specific n=1 Tax=Orbilia brochopaga TaxID=3140254 RepID=A0AAV9U9I0_9PEZI